MGTEASGKQEVMKRGYSGETPGRDGCLKSFTLCQKVAELECYLGGTRPWWKSECPACRESFIGAGNNYKLLNDKLVTKNKCVLQNRTIGHGTIYYVLASTSWPCCPPFHQGWASHSYITRRLLPLHRFSDTKEWKLLVSFLFDLNLPPSAIFSSTIVSISSVFSCFPR